MSELDDIFAAAEGERAERHAWQRRADARQILAAPLAQSNSPVAKKAGLAMQNCSRWAIFNVYELPNREIERRLVSIDRCKGSMCPQCQPARSKRLFCDLVEVVARALELQPGDRLLLVTLTIKNCPLSELSDRLDQLNEAFRKLARLRRVKRAWRGWHRTIEITRNAETGEWHPHIHLLVIVPAGYFSRNADLYITQAELAELWARCLNVDYPVRVDIRKVEAATGGQLRESLKECCKYVTKAMSLVALNGDELKLVIEPGELVELFHALRRRRLVSKGGVFRTIARDLKQLDVDDPNADWDVEEPLPEGAVYIGREFWRWDPFTQEYLIEFEPVDDVGRRDTG
jgi:plasmid rolling circle replication initiator protein Rep